jgi:type IX secretion system substrate protein
MKKLFLLTAALFSVNITLSQWQPDVRLTSNPSVSITAFNYKSIAASGNMVHAVWYDDRDGNFEVYYKRSPDEGISWGSDSRLTISAGTSWFASLAASGSEVHVIWMDDRDGNFEIYYKRSADGGLSWSGDTRLTNDTAISQFPSIALSGSIVNVIWQDSRDGNTEIYYKRSPDGGLSWGTDTRLTNNSAGSIFASVSASGSIVNVLWEEYRDGNAEIYDKHSADGGLSWSGDMRLTNNPVESFSPSAWMSGSEVHVVWYDTRDGNAEIYYKRSPDGGVSWGTDTRLTTNAAGSFHPSVTASGSNVHLAWYDERDGNREVYYKSSPDAGISWGTDARLTNNISESSHPSIAVSGQVVHVLWQDVRDGNWEIYYKRNPSGNPVGIEENESNTMQQISIYPNPNNGTFYFSTNTIIRPATIKAALYDPSGKIIFEKELNVNDRIKISNADDGIYFLRIASENYAVLKKILIVK